MEVIAQLIEVFFSFYVGPCDGSQIVWFGGSRHPLSHLTKSIPYILV